MDDVLKKMRSGCRNVQGGHHVNTQGENGHPQPGREASEKTNTADTLNLDFKFQEL